MSKGNTGRKGGQKGNNNAGKWNEETVDQLGNEWIDHVLTCEDSEIFTTDFFCKVKGFRYPVWDYLAENYPSFYKLKKMANEIQRERLAKIGISNKSAAAMVIFWLKNKPYNMTDRNTVQGEDDKPVSISIEVRTEKEKALLQKLRHGKQD